MPHQPRVTVSQVVPGSPDDVWDAVREFDSIDEFHPVIENCTIEDGRSSTEVGAVRNFEAGDRTVREKLVAFSDEDQFYQYTMADNGGDTEEYLSEFRLDPITEDDATLVTWFAHFDVVADGDLDAEIEHLQKVFGGGVEGVRESFS